MNCQSVIFHGPGHQSKTRCQKVKAHVVHECEYGSYSQTARWKGLNVFSGCFDEPPKGTDELEVESEDETYAI